MLFPVSGVETPIWVPPLVAFGISYCTSMAGVSGAFLILPFQMSVLGFVSPAVSATNLVYNVVAIPSGVYRYVREGRLIWPLTWIVVVGTLPGLVLGVFIRLTYLPNPKPFKAFVGCVLLYIGARLFWDIVKAPGKTQPKEKPKDWSVVVEEFSYRRLAFLFQGQRHECPTVGVFILSLVVGVIGGTYGIGGGAIIAPFFVAIYGLPVHTVAGATLMGTFVTSVAGVAFYRLLQPFYVSTGMAVAPDWLLGFLFGVGGLAGMYLGARTQRFVSARILKTFLGILLLAVALRYLAGYFF